MDVDVDAVPILFLLVRSLLTKISKQFVSMLFYVYCGVQCFHACIKNTPNKMNSFGEGVIFFCCIVFCYTGVLSTEYFIFFGALAIPNLNLKPQKFIIFCYCQSPMTYDFHKCPDRP